MSGPPISPLWIAAGTFVAATLAGQRAEAGGIATARFGGEHGHPTTSNPTAIYYNPAGIAASEGLNLFLDANIAFRSVTFDREAPVPEDDGEVAEPADAIGANNGTATLFNVVASPMVGLSGAFPLSDSIKLAVGAGFYVPFGGVAIWDKNDDFENNPTYAGPYDGTSRWWSIDGTIQTSYITGTAAIGIDDLVFIGISGNVGMSKIDSLRARTASGNNDLDVEGRAWVDVSSTNGGIGAGVMVRPMRDESLAIGFSYQSPPGFDGMVLSGTLNQHLGGSANPEQEIEVHQAMPDIFRLGVSYRPIETLELRLFGDYTRWSLFENQCFGRKGESCEINEDGSQPAGGGAIVNIPREWQDTGAVRLGGSFWVKDEIELFAGTGYDSNAIPDSTLDPSLLDFHDISVSLGGRFEFNEYLAAALSYTHLFYFPRDTSDTAEHGQYLAPSRQPSAGGNYRQTIGVINVNFQASFDPFSKKKPSDAPEG